jgi:molybdopterin converting factor small subunit
MKVIVEYHGMFRSMAGRADDEVEVPEGCTVGELMEKIEPRLARCRGLMFVDSQQANDATVLKNGNVLVMLSPIAGG